MKNNIMVDLETLGLQADSVVMSIGAVKFDLETGEISPDKFYCSVSIDSNLAQNRRMSETTLLWWMQQSPEAQKVFAEPKVAISGALEELSSFFDHPDYRVWSNGADFDLPILAHLYSTNMLDQPWQFHNSRCYRTLKNLPLARNAVKPPNPVAHNALFDAEYQALHLINIYRALGLRAEDKAA
jgi:hypothetical protein